MNRANGLFFPLVLENGSPVNPDLTDSIESSIRIILAWIYGTRIFNYTFGTILHSMLSAPGAEANLSILKTYLRLGILRDEPRIRIISMKFNNKEETIQLTINAVVKDTQTPIEFNTFL